MPEVGRLLHVSFGAWWRQKQIFGFRPNRGHCQLAPNWARLTRLALGDHDRLAVQVVFEPLRGFSDKMVSLLSEPSVNVVTLTTFPPAVSVS